MTTIQGMRAMARLRSDRRALEQVARIALTVFDDRTLRAKGRARFNEHAVAYCNA